VFFFRLRTHRNLAHAYMGSEHREALRVVEIVKMAGRIYEDARNHVWYVPTSHPIFSALTMVAGPVSRQIESGLLVTGVEGARRFAEVSAAGTALLRTATIDSDIRAIDRWLQELLAGDTDPR
jgi:hypothetical protein